MLYDGAIQFLNRAKVGLEQGDNSQFHSNLLGCEKIIMEFMNTLDMKLGGKLAENLYRLYEYLYNTLVKTGINRNVSGLNEVLKHLTGLRETWQKAIEISNAGKKANLMDNEEDEKKASDESYNDKYIENKDEDNDEEYEDKDKEDEDENEDEDEEDS